MCPLTHWYTGTKSATWKSFADVKQTFGTPDVFKYLAIFNVGGKYPLIAGGFNGSQEVTQTEVFNATGIPISTISELLSKKREFNVSHIEKLCVYFGLGPDAFIRVNDNVLRR